jgi:hypothetical protein
MINKGKGRKAGHKVCLVLIESMSIESLELSDAAISLLMESANTEFGCRIIAAKLRELLIDKYQEALMYAPDNKSILKMSVDKNLKTTYEWRVDENAVRIVELE